MKQIKKDSLVIIFTFACLIFVYVILFLNNNKNYSLADFGVPSLLKTDCSSIVNVGSNSPVTVSFNAPDVSTVHDSIKALIVKYNGQITDDSFTSYPSSAANIPSQDNDSITATFDKSENDFLTELSSVVKSSGGVSTSFNYSNGNQPQYTYNNSGYSPYGTCANLMQAVSLDVLQLEVFTEALKGEHNVADISILSQSISTTKSTLQNDVNAMNNFFSASDEPSVTISISTPPVPVPSLPMATPPLIRG